MWEHDRLPCPGQRVILPEDDVVKVGSIADGRSEPRFDISYVPILVGSQESRRWARVSPPHERNDHLPF